ncbi:MAG: family 78 glycoside hydrolase catalytic domain [Kiritimatiellae bacterium]|nr:family 78 glycoside hydrolase catalytic domain [Kiritimatiellia bacterium]
MSFSLLMSVALSTLSEMPWIGDGMPLRNGADWYADDPAPIFTANFVLPRGMKTDNSLRMTVVSPGCYLLFANRRGVNGKPTAVHPLWSPFDKTLYAETFSVGRLLDPYPATNEVQIILGNGWYNMPPLKFWGSKCFRDHLAHGRPCFKMAIDGVNKLEWTWRESRLVQNSYHLGEVYDMSRKIDVVPKRAAETEGPRGRLALREAPEIGPQKLPGDNGKSRWLKPGEIQVVDFGSNRTGVFFFGLSTKEMKNGDRVEFIYGERLNHDGSVNPLTQTAGQIKHGNGGDGAPKVAMQRDAVVFGEDLAKTKKYVFGNFFTWHIAQYVEIRGLKTLIPAGEAQRIAFGSQMTAVRPGKSFKPKNPDLGAIHNMCVNTFLSNLNGVQSDCPGRERLQYGGDIVATCEAMALNFNMKEFYLKTLQDFADEAADDGWITETAPYVGIADSAGLGVSEKSRRGPVSWALVVPVLMDLVIRYYPDAKKRALAFYPVCERYARMMDTENPTGIVPKCIGDHEALDRAPDNVTATAHWYEFARLTARFAMMLGRDEDSEFFNAVASKTAAAFAANFIKEGVVANGSQSAQAIALYLGLVPRQQIPEAETRLLKTLRENDYALTTGIFSTRYILMYLSEHGKADIAEKIVLRRGFPGWMHMLKHGATTLWETWKESDDGYSNCHPMFGSVDEWLLKYKLGK